GYLYFHKAPNAREFHDETVRKLDALYNFDCLRANKSMMAWGVEPRVPFLDVEFLDVAMRMDARAKMIAKGEGGGDVGTRRIEKAVLREAFEGYLPDEILWRQKEQFSDGVGYGWIDGLKAHAEAQVGDREFAAAALGTVHHGFKYTFEEGLDALPEVIRHIETFDVTTIRASTPMYLLARRIKAMGVKMVLSGEGADEIFGGYLYFHKAPNAREFHDETVRKLDALYNFDCLRANKSMMAWGVEPRVPFLDVEFLDVAMRMDAQAKMVAMRDGEGDRGTRRIEKAVLREAFEGYLPDEILWRQKEQFSDGVGYGWIDGLKAHAEAQVGDREFAAAANRFPLNPPQTREAYLYRRIFEASFPGAACAATVPGGKSIACSSPAAIAWDAAFASAADPSGRAIVGVHQAALRRM
ncbi:MAG: asparagine synthase-related protein, partial [Pseudoxanthomonas sp.]